MTSSPSPGLHPLQGEKLSCGSQEAARTKRTLTLPVFMLEKWQPFKLPLCILQLLSPCRGTYGYNMNCSTLPSHSSWWVFSWAKHNRDTVSHTLLGWWVDVLEIRLSKLSRLLCTVFCLIPTPSNKGTASQPSLLLLSICRGNSF